MSVPDIFSVHSMAVLAAIFEIVAIINHSNVPLGVSPLLLLYSADLPAMYNSYSSVISLIITHQPGNNPP